MLRLTGITSLYKMVKRLGYDDVPMVLGEKLLDDIYEVSRTLEWLNLDLPMGDDLWRQENFFRSILVNYPTYDVNGKRVQPEDWLRLQRWWYRTRHQPPHLWHLEYISDDY